MGNSQTTAAVGLSLDEIQQISHFTERDILRLYNRFRALDKDGNGVLDVTEILGVKDLSENPLVNRVVSVFDKDGNHHVSFIEFLVGLARLAATADDEQKVRFAFEVYDVNKDGFISYDDLFHVMKTMVGENLNEAQLQQLVNRQLRDSDKYTTHTHTHTPTVIYPYV